jgi:hypothetical protein
MAKRSKKSRWETRLTKPQVEEGARALTGVMKYLHIVRCDPKQKQDDGWKLKKSWAVISALMDKTNGLRGVKAIDARPKARRTLAQ